MSIQTEKFIRKVRPVEAVKVTEDNLSAIAGWSRGLVVPAGTIGNNKETYIHVPVRNPRRDADSQAFVGMWIVKEDFQNCRVVTNKQFKNSYDPVEKHAKAAPSPKTMPQKKTTVVDPSGLTEPTPEPTHVAEHRQEQVHRSAESGEFVTEAEAEANPDTTVEETIEHDLTTESEETLPTPETEEENDVNEEYINHDELASEQVEPDLAVSSVVPGDMIDPEQSEEDEDGTVQLGAPTDEVVAPELCGQCGSQVVDGVCSKDIDHDVHGTASESEKTPRILPGD